MFLKKNEMRDTENRNILLNVKLENPKNDLNKES